jgi:hypothetical protein
MIIMSQSEIVREQETRAEEKSDGSHEKARQALSSEYASSRTAASADTPEYSLASGWLTIYSHGSGGGHNIGHSWIGYKPDDTGVTTLYGTHVEGIKTNSEGKWTRDLNLEGVVGRRSVHINDRGEERLMSIIDLYSSGKIRAWGPERNCSDFAVEAYNAGSGEHLSSKGLFPFGGTPITLRRHIYEANGNRYSNKK